MRVRWRAARLIALCGFLAVVAATSLWLFWPASTLTRQAVLGAALGPDGSSRLSLSRVTGVKLVHRFDLPQLGIQAGTPNTRPWDRVWLVLIKGMLIAPSGSVGQPVTYTLEVIPDVKPAAIELYYEDASGDRPAEWDGLIDLARS